MGENLDRQIDDLTEKLTNLHEYTLINYTGFREILALHDNHTGMVASPWFLATCKEQAFYRSSDALGFLLVKLSQCCTIARGLMGNVEEAKTVVEGECNIFNVIQQN